MSLAFVRARHDPSRTSVALFGRPAGSVSVVRDGALLDHRYQIVLAEILETYGFALL
jgi:hypothetical protein